MTPETDDPTEATLRLEEALERIARAATTGIISAAAKTPGRAMPGSPVRSELTARLDSLIADIRLALANPPEGSTTAQG